MSGVTMTDQMELTKRVAELLGWTSIVPLEPGRLSGYDPDSCLGNDFQFVPSFASDLNACINHICDDDRLRWWTIGVDCITLKNRDGIDVEVCHDNTAAGVADAICQGFLKLCAHEGDDGNQ